MKRSLNYTVAKKYHYFEYDHIETMDNTIDQVVQNNNRTPWKIYDYKGYSMANDFDKYAEEIENFQIEDSDVWVISFPKCGTTWTQEMVWLIVNNFDYEGAKENLTARFPFIEFSAMVKTDSPLNTIEMARNQNQFPRCIKSHLPFELQPKEIKNKTKRPKIIYVYRHPLDACVSYYHHHNLFAPFNGTFEDYCELFMANKVAYTPYGKSILSYWRERNEPNILLIRYEDLKADLRGQVEKVAGFLEKKIENDQMEILLKHLSFESMRQNSAVNYEAFIKKSNPNGDKHFIRKGIVGDYKNRMSPDLIERFKEWYKGSGVDFLYSF